MFVPGAATSTVVGPYWLKLAIETQGQGEPLRQLMLASPLAKQYGEHMVQDHTKADQQLQHTRVVGDHDLERPAGDPEPGDSRVLEMHDRLLERRAA